jgi:hypothetical protein
VPNLVSNQTINLNINNNFAQPSSTLNNAAQRKNNYSSHQQQPHKPEKPTYAAA